MMLTLIIDEGYILDITLIIDEIWFDSQEN